MSDDLPTWAYECYPTTSGGVGMRVASIEQLQRRFGFDYGQALAFQAMIDRCLRALLPMRMRLPKGWRVRFLNGLAIAVHPRHQPRVCELRELPKPFKQWRRV